MRPDDIATYLPPLRQKLSVLVLAGLAALWMIHMGRKHRLSEEHALLWFLGIGIGVVVIWWNGLLILLTRLIGADVPASALILFAIFFLTLMTVWLTTVISRQKRQLAELIITVSMLKAQLGNLAETPTEARAADRRAQRLTLPSMSGGRPG